jgi:hypothetical protein
MVFVRANASAGNSMDRVIKDRIVFFIIAVECFILVALLDRLGWLDPIVKWLWKMIWNLLKFIII